MYLGGAYLPILAEPGMFSFNYKICPRGNYLCHHNAFIDHIVHIVAESFVHNPVPSSEMCAPVRVLVVQKGTYELYSSTDRFVS